MMALKYNVICVRIHSKGSEKRELLTQLTVERGTKKSQFQLQCLLPLMFKSFCKTGILSDIN